MHIKRNNSLSHLFNCFVWLLTTIFSLAIQLIYYNILYKHHQPAYDDDDDDDEVTHAKALELPFQTHDYRT